MTVTMAMIQAAIKSAVEDKILPSHELDFDTLIHYRMHYRESVKRMIEAALDKEGQEI
jgi:hypothetical protein